MGMERFKFTKANLTALELPEPGKRRVVYDEEVKKLALRVTSSGSMAFYVVRRTGGTMTWIKLDPFPQMTVDQARRQAALTLGEFAGGTNPAEAKRALRGEWSFADAYDDFVARKRNKRGAPISDKTKQDYSDVYRLHLSGIKNYKLSQLTREQVKALHRTITVKSPAQADKAIAMIGAIYNFARDSENFGGLNPASRVQKNPTVERDRFVKPHELPYLFNAINRSNLRDFFWLALLTGARRSNLQSMSWRDLDLSGCVWRIPKTKNGESMEIPLVVEAVAILEARKQIAGRGAVYVFPGSGKSGHLAEPKTAWAMILRMASFDMLLDAMLAAKAIKPKEYNEGKTLAAEALYKAEDKFHKTAIEAKIRPEDHSISDLRMHDLRRTFGTYQNRTGASLTIIGKSLGHKSQQSTKVYARLDLDPVRQSVASGTTAMLRAAGLKPLAEVIPMPSKGAA